MPFDDDFGYTWYPAGAPNPQGLPTANNRTFTSNSNSKTSFQLNPYDGGWADYVRRRDELRAPARAPADLKPAKPKKAGAPKPREGPSELERIEAEIAARERGVADLEDRLAKDWNDVDLLAAHRSARDELQTLLQRWERLFERAHS